MGPGTREMQGWGAIELSVPESLEDALLVAAGEACLGAEFRATTPGRGRLMLYFDEVGTAADRRDAVVAALRVAGLTPEACALRLARVEDELWVEHYQRTLQPFPIGRRFVVDPSGQGRVIAGCTPISLVPGQAFGTGEHPTTRMCVTMLEQHVQAGSRWLDVGCGSGILSVVVRRCGASRVLSLDIDPTAVEVAREVVLQNGVAESVRVVRGSHDAAEPGAWDGVVINISATYFLECSTAISDLPRPGGTVVASGFLEPECDTVSRALVEGGLVETARETSAGWCAMTLRARKGPG